MMAAMVTGAAWRMGFPPLRPSFAAAGASAVRTSNLKSRATSRVSHAPMLARLSYTGGTVAPRTRVALRGHGCG